MRRGAQCRLVRDGTVVYDGRIGSLRRFKDDVREVTAGMECGIVLENYPDVKEGDVIEVYENEAGRADAHLGARAFVCLLEIELHFPENGSLKGKRKELSSRQGAAAAALRRGGRRDRPSRPVAARDADRGARGPRRRARCKDRAAEVERYVWANVSRRGQCGNASSCLPRTSIRVATDRMRRVNEAVREVLSARIAEGLNDPRIGFVTVTSVETSPTCATPAYT